MAITLVGTGVGAAAASGNVTPALPADLLANDIILVVTGLYGSDTLSCSGYTKKAEYTAGSGLGVETQATLFWKRHDGSESDPTVTGATNSITAQCFAFRGVDTGVDPWDAWDAGLETGYDLDVGFPTLTTNTDGAMVVLLAGTANNNTYSPSFLGYGALDSDTGMEYVLTILGSDASHLFMHGVQAVAGSIGSPYATKQTITTQTWVSMAGALKPGVTSTFYLNAAILPDFTPDAAITSLTPSSGLVGATVTIAGTDFRSSGTVLFGATEAAQVSWSDTEIVVTVPDVVAGATDVTVIPANEYTSNAVSFNVYEPLPAADPTETNPLFDGSLAVTVARAALPRYYHDFTSVILPGLAYSSTNPGGFGECTFQIAATSPYAAFVHDGHTMAKGDLVRIRHGSDRTVLFEGAITNDVTHAVIEGGEAYYDVTAAGLWWKAGIRGDYCLTWFDDDPGQWFEKNTKGGVFQVDTDGKVEIRLESGQELKASGSKSLYYWLDSGLGGGSEVQYILGLASGRTTDMATPTVNWKAAIETSDSPWGTWTARKTWANLSEFTDVPFVVDLALVSNVRAVRLRLWADQAVAGMTSDRYISLRRFVVTTEQIQPSSIDVIGTESPKRVTTVDAHTFQAGDRIFIEGSNSTPSIDGWQTIGTVVSAYIFTLSGVNGGGAGSAGDVYDAHDVRLDTAMSDVAMSTNLAATDEIDSTLGPLQWSLNVRPHATRADAIESIASLHSAPVDFGFWEDDTFYCKERIAAAGTHDILVDSGDPAIDFNVFADTEDSPTHVKVLYLFRDVDGGTDPIEDGTLRAVYRPSAPTWTDAAITLDVWDQWADVMLTSSQAEYIGDQILAWLKNNKYVGTVTIATPTVPLRSGGDKFTAYIRAGDYIEDANLATGPLMITSAQMDVDSGTVTLGIGETRREFVRRLGERVRIGRRPDRSGSGSGPYHR